MTIDEHYGLPLLNEAHRIPTNQFPHTLQQRLNEVLLPLSAHWFRMEIDTFERNNAAFLKVTLDLGDRPLHLYLHQDGDVFQFDAPIYFSFPAAASHFVLSELCGAGTFVSFRLDSLAEGKYVNGANDLRQSKDDHNPKRGVMESEEILYGWGKFDFTMFLTTAPALLPYLIDRLADAQTKLKHHLDNPSPITSFAA